MVSETIRACSVHFVLVLSICHWVQIKAEVYTAMSEIELLLQTHQRFIDDINEYIASEEKRLATLKKRLHSYKKEHEMAIEDVPKYLSNPINAFTLIKRLTTDLNFIRKNIRNGTGNTKNITSNHKDVKYPTSEDLTGAAEALLRLQKVYKLDIHELSEGVLNGVAYSSPMTAGDCYELGLALFKSSHVEDALPWLIEAQRKYKEDSELHHFSEFKIVEYISVSHYYLGNLKTALEVAKNARMMYPEHPRAADYVAFYQEKVTEKEATELARQSPLIRGIEEMKKNSTVTERSTNMYEILCREEMNVPPVIAKSLYCRYVTGNHPFLRLAPLKVEYKYLQPDIVIVHDVMSDAEIRFIQETAKPRLKRAMVRHKATDGRIFSKARIGKLTFIRDEESEIIARISRRVAVMTGLTMDTAEALQVLNYGIGGQYEPHNDFYYQRNETLVRRIGTVLFYLSDVEQGGATVFTELGVSLVPIKGAAAFWFNLHPSGEGALAARHGSCPVLRGSKWIATKWLHQAGQEFLKPCYLEHQQHEQYGWYDFEAKHFNNND